MTSRWSGLSDWKSLTAAAFLVLGLSSGSCSPGERFTVNEAIVRHVGNTLTPAGSGCANITLPGSGGADNSGPRVGDFSVTEGPDVDAYLVRVFSDQDLLAERRYGEAMLVSGSVDEFSVTTHKGAVYTLRCWGGPCSLGADGSIE
jgi:hypothetical protein